MKNIAISEYGYIYFKKPKNLNEKYTHAKIDNEKDFDELYTYWEDNVDTQKIFEYKRGKALKATSYVGIIQTKNLSIEILPKIYDGESNEVATRNIFTQMLKPILDLKPIEINKANLSVTNNKNIYEIFISLFIEHLDKLIHRGLKSQYISKEDNQYFLKGKLKFNQHLKQNYIHKERFYVEYDEYMQDRVENRLLKSAVALLLKKTSDFENKRALRQQMFIFDEVRLSTNYDVDFRKVNTHRGMEYYEMPLRFAKVFLKHQSFTSLRGNDNVFALLFPMQTVFEKYIEYSLNNSKDVLGINSIMVNGGKNEYLLSNGKCNMARLQPDYLLKMDNGIDIVTDAKWKLLETKEDESKGCETVNIASGDVYQIFSYLHFYDCEDTAYLFVPEVGKIDGLEFEYLKNQSDIGNKKLKIVPINLEEMISSHQFQENIFNNIDN
ncbi:McrC family protein [Sulfurimonas sp.]|jgi:5-methylcytosine-specific restriction enzyme subunit McrC|uniref:McrC family protein n=1 Tax=Sulfurimonas sp. TaxID=2022749 RepID=UPI0025CCCFB9|nr:McrC family protein [Sulfurimonas sp.]MBT5934604.1 McrC family protein [Sulfurimonas sp.]